VDIVPPPGPPKEEGKSVKRCVKRCVCVMCMCEESVRDVKRRVEEKCVNIVSADRREAPGKQLPFLGAGQVFCSLVAHLLKIR